jgi:hypothetical protein
VTLAGSDVRTVALNRFNPGPAPTLVAGTIRLRGLPDHWFGYSYLSRQRVNIGTSASAAGSHDVLPSLAGPEDYVAQFKLDEKLSEHWFGLTWSRKLSGHVGLGLSQYVAVRNHRAYAHELVEALAGDGRLVTALGARQFSYFHFRVLWKVGLACDFEWITLGLTLTSPSLALGGTGTTGMDSSLAGLDGNGDGVPDDYLAADFRDRLAMTYRSPLSLAAGMTLKIRKVRVYWSAEWFARVRAYTIVDAPEFPAQSTGEIMSTDVSQELAATLNWGAGVEWFYSSRFKGYASFTTDFSAIRPGTLTNASLTDWDIHHIVTGGEFMVKKSSFTLGLGISFGGREIGGRPAFFARNGLDGIWDPLAGLRFRFATFKAIIGFAI